MWLNAKRGILRQHIKGYIKERQFRHNNGEQDIFAVLLNAWADLENDLREGVTTLKSLKKLLEWDWKSYKDRPNVLPRWRCGGCNFSFKGLTWQEERKKHKKSCRYYNLPLSRTYEHSDSRCICCTIPYHQSAAFCKHKITKVIFSFDKFLNCFSQLIFLFLQYKTSPKNTEILDISGFLLPPLSLYKFRI